VRSRLATLLLLACALTACGGDDGGSDRADRPPPEATPDQFPSAAGKTLVELYEELPSGGPVLAPAVNHLVVGENRFGFGLFTASRAQIADAAAAVYIAPAGGGEAQGPFVAKYGSLDVEPQFQSRTTASDPDAATTVYVATLPFEKPGRWEMLGMARRDGRLVAALSASPGVRVARDDPVPGPGDRAPVIHTPTEAEVAGDLEQIDTRVPPSSQHEADFADVVGKKPVVLSFATPRLCQSRVCGPVIDVAEQVKAEYGEEAEFIHMEIFEDNDVSKGYRPQVAAWGLPSEPWVFTVDASGRVAARIEGAYSAEELEAAIQKAL
jgi:hypothetical protein